MIKSILIISLCNSTYANSIFFSTVNQQLTFSLSLIVSLQNSACILHLHHLSVQTSHIAGAQEPRVAGGSWRLDWTTWAWQLLLWTCFLLTLFCNESENVLSLTGKCVLLRVTRRTQSLSDTVLTVYTCVGSH